MQIPFSILVSMATGWLVLAMPIDRCGGQPLSDGGAESQSKAIVESADWKFETVELQRGETYKGLIRSESADEIEFVEIHRPPAKPMFAVVRPISSSAIKKLSRLSEEDHRELEERFERLRNRSRVEAGEIEQVRLQSVTVDGDRRLRYEGQWFVLESSANEELTRRSVVRINQIFRAYRLLLPPGESDGRPLRILLLGSLDQYRRHLRQLGLDLKTPAYYSVNKNQIVAGSRLNGYAERLRQTTEQIERARRDLLTLDMDFASRIERLRQRMTENNFSQEEINQEVQLRRSRWSRDRDARLTEIERTLRYNNDFFNQVTESMFRRLSHEAFHAYLQNYVIAADTYELPRWLNEGLAQVFETAQLDAGIMRVDAPSRDKLTALQKDLLDSEPLAIANVLVADENTFLVAHAGQQSQRHYLYSWGLAYFLLFDADLLSGGAILRYAANPEGFGPSARFTALIGMPLSKFEKRWRAKMLSLRPSG